MHGLDFLGHILLYPRMHIFAAILTAALGLFLGMPNPFLQIPPAVLLYPAALAWLGSTAQNRMTAFRHGWLTGILGFSGVLYWLAVPVHTIGMMPWSLAAACALAMAAYVGLYGGLFALILHAVRTETLVRRVLWAGIGWYGLEWLRSWLFTGFPWAPLAAAFVPWPVAIQSVSVIGAYGLSGVLAGLSTACLFAGMERRPRAALATLGIAGLLLVGGLWRLSQPLATGPALDMLLVQGNVGQNVKWEPVLQQSTVDRYLNLTESGLNKLRAAEKAPASENPPPFLVVWPETAMPFDFEVSPFTAQIVAFALNNRITLLTGSVGLDLAAKKYLNRAYMFGPDTATLRWYEKEHLVPFGEYLPPWLNIAILRPFLQGIGDFAPGKRTTPLPLQTQEISGSSLGNRLVPGVLICYEIIFPEFAQKLVANGANLLLNISNDAWFGQTSAPEQHLQLSVLRAVEQARPLARGTNTGFSAFADPHGRIVAKGSLFRAETLAGRVVTANGKTVFFHMQPWLPPAGLIFAGWLFVRRRRK